jgi:subtilase family serine protease
VIVKSDGVTPDATATPPSGAYGPADIQSAYGLPGGTAGATKTVGIVVAYDNPNAESDLAAYRNQFGLPPCTSTANSCFRKVNQSGNSGPLPAGNVGWGQELALDLQATSAACPGCKLLAVVANSAAFDDLGAAVNTAVRLGANVVNNSYGAKEFWGETSYDRYYNHPGVAMTVSSGDNGFVWGRAEYPSASAYVTSVGGTSLFRSSTSRGWSENAWNGAGSGCSKYVSKPSWQKDAGCARRITSDVSAVADPNTGFAVYDTYGSSGGENWYQFGGTSLAAPILAGVFAMGGNPTTSNIYGHAGSLFDVTSGSNGSCSPSYYCTAQAGYDGPTGLGTPNGLGAFGGAIPGGVTSTTSSTSTSTSTTAPTTTSTSTSTTSTTAPTTTSTSTSTTSTTVATTTSTSTSTTSTTIGAGLPGVPQNFRVTSTVGGISLAWNPPATGGAPTQYRIYRGAWGAETLLTTVTGTSFTDVTPMWTYYFYRVAAVNGAGQGPYTADLGAQRTG